LSFDRASTIPLALATAAIGLTHLYTDNIRLDKAADLPGGQPGFSYESSDTKAFWENGAEGSQNRQPLLVFGGASAVGQFVIQIASFLGFSPIITTTSSHNTNLLKGFGAMHVVDRYGDVVSSIKEIMQSTPLTMIYDAVHVPITQAEIDLLSPGGKLLIMWHLPDDLDLSGDKQILTYFGSVWLHKEFGKGMYSKLQIFLEHCGYHQAT